MSMLDENSFAGLECAETHGLGTENVQNRNMSLVMKISATRDPTSHVDSSTTLLQICRRPLYFQLPEPTSACNINHVGFDHHCLHSSNVVLWGDIFGDPPLHPDEAFSAPSRRKRPKPSDLSVLLPPAIFGAVHLPPVASPSPPPHVPIVQASVPFRRPAAAATHVADQTPLHHPPSSGSRSVSAPTAAPASQLAPPASSSSSQSALKLTASRSALPPARAPKEASTKARPVPPPKKQSKASFLSFSDDGIQSIKQHNRRAGSSMAGAKNSVVDIAGAEQPSPPAVEGIARADEQPDFTVFSPPSSYGGIMFPGQVSFSASLEEED